MAVLRASKIALWLTGVLLVLLVLSPDWYGDLVKPLKAAEWPIVGAHACAWLALTWGWSHIPGHENRMLRIGRVAAIRRHQTFAYLVTYLALLGVLALLAKILDL